MKLHQRIERLEHRKKPEKLVWPIWVPPSPLCIPLYSLEGMPEQHRHFYESGEMDKVCTVEEASESIHRTTDIAAIHAFVKSKYEAYQKNKTP